MLERHFASFLILPAVSGLLYLLCFPTINRGYLAWIALVPLLMAICIREGCGWAFLAGFMAGLVFNASLLSWIPGVMMNYGGFSRAGAWSISVLPVALQSLFPGTACSITRWCMNRRGEACLFIFPCAWVAMEYLESYLPFGGFPWLLFGYSQTNHPFLIQIADITGVYGVSFMLLWANIAAVWLLLKRSARWGSLWPVSGAAILLAGAMYYGRLSLLRWSPIHGQHRVAMLQQNISANDTPREMERKFREGYIKSADTAAPGQPDLLILPESPSPLSFQFDESYRKSIVRLAGRYPLGLIFNNISFSETRGATRYFNSAYFLKRDGTEAGRYDKIHLVPFGEYVPLKSLFYFVESISKDVSDFQPGRAYLTVPINGHRVSAMICYEAVFPQISRRFAAEGSQLLINLTNDAWYGDTGAPYQHLAIASWRAIENRRYLLRSTNSGISAVVEPTGRLQTTSGLLREDVCLGSFSFLDHLSPYARCGDVFAFLCVTITGLLFLYCQRFRPFRR